MLNMLPVLPTRFYLNPVVFEFFILTPMVYFQQKWPCFLQDQKSLYIDCKMIYITFMPSLIHPLVSKEKILKVGNVKFSQKSILGPITYSFIYKTTRIKAWVYLIMLNDFTSCQILDKPNCF